MEHGSRPRKPAGERKSETTVYDISAPFVALLKLLCTRVATGIYVFVLGVLALVLPGLQNSYVLPETRIYELQAELFHSIGFLFVPVATVIAAGGILVMLKKLYLLRLYLRQILSLILFLVFLTGLLAEQTIGPNSLYPLAQTHLLAGNVGNALRSGLFANIIWITAGLTCIT